MSNDTKLIAAINRLTKELARNTAAGERALRESEKAIKSLGETMKQLPNVFTAAGLSVSSSRKKRRAA